MKLNNDQINKKLNTHEIKISTLIKTANKMRKEIDEFKVDDQTNIKLINIQQEFASLKAWVEQISKSEALYAERVIQSTMDIAQLQKQVLQLQECEDLRDKQMKVLETVINKQIKFIENHVN